MNEKTAILNVGFRSDMVILTIEGVNIPEDHESVPLVLGYSIETTDLLIGALRQAQQEVKKLTMLNISSDVDVQNSTTIENGNE